QSGETASAAAKPSAATRAPSSAHLPQPITRSKNKSRILYHCVPFSLDVTLSPTIADSGRSPAACGFMKPAYWEDAKRALTLSDPGLGRLIVLFPDVHLTRRGDPFTTLARAIVGQQISVKAAQTIWDRFVVAVKAAGEPPRLDPARVGRTRVSTLRRCGFSERKALYVRDLARHFVTGALDPGEWPDMSDEALIER